MAEARINSPEENEISIKCEAEYKEYPYDKSLDIWTLVTLKAPCHESEVKRAPIDIVAVIDKSGSMSGKKLELVKMTIEFVVGQLNDDDRLSLVTYDTHVNLDFSLMKMKKDSKSGCLDKIRNIKAGSCTNLSGGLLKGLEQIMSRDDDQNEVASVLLFTDGLANEGITKSAGIVAAMKNPKMYAKPGARSDSTPKHKSWLQKITGKKDGPVEHSDATASSEEGKQESMAPASVYTFGFGADHDPEMLKAISDAGNGMYYFVENEDKIAESFGHCLGGLLSTIGQGIKLNLSAQEGVKIKEVHVNRPFDVTADKKSLDVDMGDLQSEEERDIVLQLSIDALPIPRKATPQPLFEVEANYFNVILENLSASNAMLNVLRTSIAENKPEESSATVNKQRDRIETTVAIKRATEMADNEDFESARQMLVQQIQSNKSKAYADDEYMGVLNQDLDMCTNALRSKSVWKKKGKKVHMNIAQMHEQQRSSEVEERGRYQSKSKVSMKDKFKKASKNPTEEE